MSNDASLSPLRPFQQRVAETLLRGKSVILQAPTGSGKTHAALAPFMQNLADGGNALPPTCRYAVPMRVLTEQFLNTYRNLAADLDQHSGTQFQRIYDERFGLDHPVIARQTGETNEDAQLESLVTFCTIDQLLASFMGQPYGMSSSRANLNVAAVAGSYLVLDEFHLYPVEQDGGGVFGARTTTLEMLRLLKPLSPFVLMTATLSTPLVARLGQLLGAEVECLRDERGVWRESELRGIAGRRERHWELCHEGLCADVVLEAHRDVSLVLCNTVLRAQRLYSELRERLGDEGPRLCLLHARFTPKARRGKSDALITSLGKDAWEGAAFRGDGPLGNNVIVVATQAVEVGLDIAASVLHTELAPASSLIQRAGRCARFVGQRGLVRIYPLRNADGTPAKALPYREDLCATTWDALDALGADQGTDFDFQCEQKLIDAVHTDEDTKLLDRYESFAGQVRSKIFGSLAGIEAGARGTLIRRDASVSVVIHAAPEQEITSNPWEYVAFSLRPETLSSRLEALQKRAAATPGLDWVVKRCELGGGDTSDRDRDSQWRTPCEWTPISSKEQIEASVLLCLPPQLAAYDDDLGFRLLLDGGDAPTNWQSGRQERERGTKPRGTGSQIQHYVEHIAGLRDAYNWSVRADLGWQAGQLEESMDLPRGSVDAAIRLILALHDLGKLSIDWQRWAVTWQQRVSGTFPHRYRPPLSGEMLAKTDFDNSREQRQLQHDLELARPHHACEGALLSHRLIFAALPDRRLARAAVTAIAGHHSANARTYGEARLAPGAREALSEALTCCSAILPPGIGLDHIEEHTGATLREEGSKIAEKWIILPNNPTAGDDDDLDAKDDGDPTASVWLSFLLTRALRLCDQRAGLKFG